MDKIRLLVTLHAGDLSIESVNISDRSASLHIPNEEVFSTALAYLGMSGVPFWRKCIDKGLSNDDMRLIIEGMLGRDGFLQF